MYGSIAIPFHFIHKRMLLFTWCDVEFMRKGNSILNSVANFYTILFKAPFTNSFERIFRFQNITRAATNIQSSKKMLFQDLSTKCMIYSVPISNEGQNHNSIQLNFINFIINYSYESFYWSFSFFCECINDHELIQSNQNDFSNQKVISHQLFCEKKSNTKLKDWQLKCRSNTIKKLFFYLTKFLFRSFIMVFWVNSVSLPLFCITIYM